VLAKYRKRLSMFLKDGVLDADERAALAEDFADVTAEEHDAMVISEMKVKRAAEAQVRRVAEEKAAAHEEVLAKYRKRLSMFLKDGVLDADERAALAEDFADVTAEEHDAMVVSLLGERQKAQAEVTRAAEEAAAKRAREKRVLQLERDRVAQQNAALAEEKRQFQLQQKAAEAEAARRARAEERARAQGTYVCCPFLPPPPPTRCCCSPAVACVVCPPLNTTHTCRPALS
jgi:hypothetical protein